ncbi:hypothetical protein RI367_001418 [Sorochytrium milnesiophthora]
MADVSAQPQDSQVLSGEAQFVAVYLTQLQTQPLEYPDHFTPTKISIRPKSTKPALSLSVSELPATVTLKLKLLKSSVSPTVAVPHDSSIAAIKPIIARALELAADTPLKLLVKGKVLADDKLVRDYDALTAAGASPAVVNVMISKVESGATSASPLPDDPADVVVEDPATLRKEALSKLRQDAKFWKDIEKAVQAHAGKQYSSDVMEAFKSSLSSLQ